MLNKVLKLSFGLFIIGSSSFAQWSGTSNETITSGNVGIGTTNPNEPLTLETTAPIMASFKHNGLANAAVRIGTNNGYMNLGVGAVTLHPYIWSNTNSLFIGSDGAPTLFVNGMANGNVGIGTSDTRGYKLAVNGSAIFETTEPIMATFKHNGVANAAVQIGNNNGTVNLGVGTATPHPYIWSNTGKFFIGDDGNPTMFINMGNGNVGIGTVTPGSFKLAVEGKIAAREIQVTLQNPFPDYVFNKKYKLRSLYNLESYINQNKHLPGIPSAAEVEKKGGIELGQLNTKLVEKIEELTLYIIEINKKVEKLEKENESLKKGN